MTVVPISTDRVLPTAPAPVYQTDNVPAAAFGTLQAQGTENAGAGLQKAGDDVFAVARRQMYEDAMLQAKKSDMDLRGAIRTIQYGDGTPENPGQLTALAPMPSRMPQRLKPLSSKQRPTRRPPLPRAMVSSSLFL